MYSSVFQELTETLNPNVCHMLPGTNQGLMALKAASYLPSLSTNSAVNSSGSLWAIAQRFYHEEVVDHYEHPRNVGSFSKDDPSVGTGLVGAPACGDVMKLQIKVRAWL